MRQHNMQSMLGGPGDPSLSAHETDSMKSVTNSNPSECGRAKMDERDSRESNQSRICGNCGMVL